MNYVDEQYINLLKDILENGVEKETRSGRVLSVFGRMLRFPLQGNHLPILTTKKMFYRGCIEELLWFLSGVTNIKPLLEKNVHIWDDDAYRFYKTKVEASNKVFGTNYEIVSKEDFLKKALWGEVLSKTYKFGDLGPVYGHQWKNFGNSGVDQIQNIIETLKTNPNDRRMICVAYNPSDVAKMALPPCHTMFQMYTRQLSRNEIWDAFLRKYPDEKDLYLKFKSGKLPKDFVFGEFIKKHDLPEYGISCMWSQRSCDVPLGLPFNILSYACLTYMIAEVVNMVPDMLIGSLGDCHIYLNQMDGVNEQLKRQGSTVLPTLKFGRHVDNINDFKYEDFIIQDYVSDPIIKFPLSVG